MINRNELKSVIVDTNALEHHGVKGMKWGIRKDKKPKHSESYRKHKSMYRKRKYMTDDEIKKQTNRLNLENNYREAIKKSRNPLAAAYQDALVKAVVGLSVAGTLKMLHLKK